MKQITTTTGKGGYTNNICVVAAIPNYFVINLTNGSHQNMLRMSDSGTPRTHSKQIKFYIISCIVIFIKIC